MNFSPITLGVVILVILALTAIVAYSMAGRQQEALKLEHKPVPSKQKIFLAGLLTVLFFMTAIATTILMLIAPFVNLNLTSSVDNTTSLLIWIIVGLAVVGIALDWIFVKLGLFSWKTFTLDS